METDLTQLQQEVGEWSRENFGTSPLHGGSGSPPEHAQIGVGEELGELTRSVLKRAQGIDSDEKYAERDDVGPEAEKDAVGDIVIYLADMLHRAEDEQLDFGEGYSRASGDLVYEQMLDGDDSETPVDMIRVLYSRLGEMSSKRLYQLPDEQLEKTAEEYDWADGPPDRLTVLEYDAGAMVVALDVFCQIRGYDIDGCIQDAWEEVSGREWNAEVGDD